MIITIKSKGSFANQMVRKLHTDIADIIIDICDGVVSASIYDELVKIKNFRPSLLTVDKIKEIANNKSEFFNVGITIEESEDSLEEDNQEKIPYERPRAVDINYEDGWPVLTVTGMMYDNNSKTIYTVYIKITPGIVTLKPDKAHDCMYQPFTLNMSEFTNVKVDNAVMFSMLRFFNDICERSELYGKFITDGYNGIVRYAPTRTYTYAHGQGFNTVADMIRKYGNYDGTTTPINTAPPIISPSEIRSGMSWCYTDPNTRLNKDHF